MFATLQYFIIIVLSVAAFLGAAWALIQGLRFPDSAYVAAGKLNKLKWGLILGVALLIAFLATAVAHRHRQRHHGLRRGDRGRRGGDLLR